MRNPSANQARVAALGHNRDVKPGPDSHNRRNLTGITWPNYTARLATEPSRPVRRVPIGNVGIRQHVLRTGNGGKFGKEVVHEYSPYGPPQAYSSCKECE